MASVQLPAAPYAESAVADAPTLDASTVRASSAEQQASGDRLRQSRAAQSEWSALPIQRRLGVLRRIRHGLAAQAQELTALVAASSGRPTAEALSGEVLPLLDAGRFLERQAARSLAARRLGIAGRPLWLNVPASEVQRVAYGVVLILGPANNPLFIPGVQCLQALAAGNAVWLKPGTGTGAVAERFARIAADAGLDPRLLQVWPDSTEAGREAAAAGVDKVVLTGAAETGRTVLAQLAPRLTPATLELSGSDAVIIRADADLAMTVNALLFGLRFNHGTACIAPRRVFIQRERAAELEANLIADLQPLPLSTSCNAPAQAAAEAVIEALGLGARLLTGKLGSDGALAWPVVLAGTRPEIRMMRESYGLPILTITDVDSDDQAVAGINACPYRLGAAIFSANETAARKLAGQLHCGVVTINDLMVPTADPRLPFGGYGMSGYGVTRGLEGLLEMTRPKVITISRGSWRPHFDTALTSDECGFHQYLQIGHAGSALKRLRAFIGLAGYLLWTNLTQPTRRPFFRRSLLKPTNEQISPEDRKSTG